MAKFESGMEAMVDMYIFETTTLVEQLDLILMKTENESSFGDEEINEIFRIMHTIKGSSSMMGLENMAKMAHIIEDMFYIIREDKPVIHSTESLYELIFTASDLIKAEIELLQSEDYAPADFTEHINKINDFLKILKGEAPQGDSAASVSDAGAESAADPESDLTVLKVFFDDDCKMENLRALLVVNAIKDECARIEYFPEDIETNTASSKIIVEHGFTVKFKPLSDVQIDEIINMVGETVNVKSYEIIEMGVAAEAVSGAPGVTTVKVFFDEDCKMENLRALLVINNIRRECESVSYSPENIEEDSETSRAIIENGFLVNFKASDPERVVDVIVSTPNVKSCEIVQFADEARPEPPAPEAKPEPAPEAVALTKEPQNIERKEAPKMSDAVIPKTNEAGQEDNSQKSIEQLNKMLGNSVKPGAKQSLISVNLNKLDTLLDLVGEIVITEAMVTSNPDLKGLRLDGFQKAARQLRKLNSELQDTVMSIRMVPISGAFNKMTRIVRDMKVKLNKDVDLAFEGEETEVDKSIIDQLNDPFMHMVRNSMDHGIEDSPEERIAKGKSPKGKITLSAYNSSGEVIIVIADDGGGIDANKVLMKAERNGLLTRPMDEYTEKEAFNMIMLPGFSTNEQVTEYSGRGVGMDVVRKNIEKIGGTVSVDSKFGEGTSFIIKIPLSLSIVDGMEVSVGKSIFTIPINSIRESFKIKPNQLVKDTSGKEMLMIRGECYPLIRLYSLYDIEACTEELSEGIALLVEAEGRSACLFADELIGEQQVVVKPFSPLLNNFNVKQNGMAGCSILGDGSITIILDVSNIVSFY